MSLPSSARFRYSTFHAVMVSRFLILGLSVEVRSLLDSVEIERSSEFGPLFLKKALWLRKLRGHQIGNRECFFAKHGAEPGRS